MTSLGDRISVFINKRHLKIDIRFQSKLCYEIDISMNVSLDYGLIYIYQIIYKVTLDLHHNQ